QQHGERKQDRHSLRQSLQLSQEHRRAPDRDIDRGVALAGYDRLQRVHDGAHPAAGVPPICISTEASRSRPTIAPSASMMARTPPVAFLYSTSTAVVLKSLDT